jgi:hypothetical protein
MRMIRVEAATFPLGKANNVTARDGGALVNPVAPCPSVEIYLLRRALAELRRGHVLR